MLNKNRGEGNFGLFVLIVVALAVVYVGFKWGTASWIAGDFRSAVNDSFIYWSSHGAPPRNNMIIEFMQKAKANDVELFKEDIEIQQHEKFISIYIYWEMPLEFPFDKTYYLSYTIEKELRRR